MAYFTLDEAATFLAKDFDLHCSTADLLRAGVINNLLICAPLFGRAYSPTAKIRTTRLAEAEVEAEIKFQTDQGLRPDKFLMLQEARAEAHRRAHVDLGGLYVLPPVHL